MRVALAPLLATLACASASPTPTPTPAPRPAPITRAPMPAPPPPEPAEVARWETLSRELASALKAAGPPCSAVASAMRAFVDAHGADLSAAHRALVAWEAGAPPRQVEAFYRRVFPSADVRIEAGIRCKDHRATVEAYDRFFQAAGLDAR